MKKIACIVKGYPRLSETFISQEILALENAGIDIIIYSLRQPTDSTIHPIHNAIKAKVHYLPEYLYMHPIRVLKALFRYFFKRRFYQLLNLFFKDLRRDFTINRIRRLGQALVLANELKSDRQWLYVHFLHTPASVTRYCSFINQIPWSCSAHAKDIWTTPRWEIQEKLNELKWLVTCTKFNLDYLKSLCADKSKVSLIYHGLDLQRFPTPLKRSTKDGRDQENTVCILSVGRAVNKKGYDVLLEALSKLNKDLNWRFIHVGDGPLMKTLRRQALQLQIADKTSWLGALEFERVIKQYQQADVFVLASRIDDNGDRDGLPNVLMEALSQKLACVTTPISGIPEIIIDQETGILVPSEDSDKLAIAISKLIKDSHLRKSLGENGYDKLVNDFSMQQTIKPLINLFNTYL